MAAQSTVLVVDDVPSVCDLIAMTLRYEGFAVHVAGSGEEALAVAAQVRPDVAVLDVMLPDVNGFAVAERLVATGAPPAILFLTSRDDLQSKLRGLGVGDDYLTKPFEVDELVARVRCLLRREAGEGERAGRAPLSYDDLVMDEGTYQVTRGGRRIELTPTEHRLLRHLLVHAELVQTRTLLLEAVWGGVQGFDSRVLETYISYLRRKVDAGGQPLIHTVRAVGYVLRTAPA